MKNCMLIEWVPLCKRHVPLQHCTVGPEAGCVCLSSALNPLLKEVYFVRGRKCLPSSIAWYPGTFNKIIIFKLLERDTCLFLGRVYWLPHFLLLIAQQPLGGFSSNLVLVCSSPGKMSEYAVMTFQPIREVWHVGLYI